MEKLSVGSGPDFVDYCGFEVDHDCSRDVIARKGLRKEGTCGIVLAKGFGIVKVTVWGNAMFKTEQLPAGVTQLNSPLANVDGNYLSHFLRLTSYLDCFYFILQSTFLGYIIIRLSEY